jgi:hypothetical protein
VEGDCQDGQKCLWSVSSGVSAPVLHRKPPRVLYNKKCPDSFLELSNTSPAVIRVPYV